MRNIIILSLAALLAGCGTVLPMVAGWQSDSKQAREAAVLVRLQLFCNMSFAAAIEMYPDKDDFARAQSLCKSRAAP
jgi:uncharacterized protein YceK